MEIEGTRGGYNGENRSEKNEPSKNPVTKGIQEKI